MVQTLKTTVMQNNDSSRTTIRLKDTLVHLLDCSLNLILIIVPRIHLHLADSVLQIGIFQALKKAIYYVEAHRRRWWNLINILRHNRFFGWFKDLELVFLVIDRWVVYVNWGGHVVVFTGSICLDFIKAVWISLNIHACGDPLNLVVFELFLSNKANTNNIRVKRLESFLDIVGGVICPVHHSDILFPLLMMGCPETKAVTGWIHFYLICKDTLFI